MNSRAAPAPTAGIGQEAVAGRQGPGGLGIDQPYEASLKRRYLMATVEMPGLEIAICADYGEKSPAVVYLAPWRLDEAFAIS